MSNQTDHTIVRLRVPPELKQKIEDSAEKNNRSQSAEMVARLEQSFDSPMVFDPRNANLITTIVAQSMQTLISELRSEGVENDKLAKAVNNVANKKAP
ncbi:Arc family DNA-binding protein [Acinetobacter sp. YH12086]|uniref:Arc family DNA-binding protein n=1 Tax=Acinetobacter sp. YH12086 TaxID=2601078 RepID=UPI0015D26D52|nr:Arc family DNA-binding protein [Acinetobacter sp. YH12086]